MLERLPYFRCMPADYLLDTLGLSQGEHGAYWLLMAHYYWNGSLPIEQAALHSLTCAKTDDEKKNTDAVIGRFFHNEQGRMIHHRIERELEKITGFVRGQSRKGTLSAESRAKKKRNKPAAPINGAAHGFAEFYAAYPRKQQRAAAEKAWIKIAPDESLRASIMLAVRTQAASTQWTKDAGKFIPHPASWLNGKRWEDEVAPPQERRVAI